MLELVIVRHGETDSNLKSIYHGWSDTELNEKGIYQANEAAEKLKGIKIDKIFSSPLKRAYKTAEIINRNHELKIQCSEKLKERNFGIWENLSYYEIQNKYPSEHKLWMDDWINYIIKDGESALEAYNRNRGFIHELKALKFDGRFLIVTHQGCIRNMVSFLLDMGLEGSWRFRADNVGISKIQINDEGFAFMTGFNL